MGIDWVVGYRGEGPCPVLSLLFGTGLLVDGLVAPSQTDCTNMSFCAIAALRAGTIIETNTHCLAVLCNGMPTFLE